MTKEALYYYNQVKKKFPLHQKEEKQFLESFKQTLNHYSTNHPQISYDDYMQIFGEPYAIISAYYEHIESEYIIEQMKIKKMIQRILTTFLVILILIGLYLTTLYFQNEKDIKDSQIFTEEYTIVVED